MDYSVRSSKLKVLSPALNFSSICCYLVSIMLFILWQTSEAFTEKLDLYWD